MPPEDKKYTAYDIEQSEKIGGILASIQHLHDKFDRVIADKEALWKKIDSHAEELSKLKGFNRWIIGVGLGFQLGWAALMYWLKKN